MSIEKGYIRFFDFDVDFVSWDLVIVYKFYRKCFFLILGEVFV